MLLIRLEIIISYDFDPEKAACLVTSEHLNEIAEKQFPSATFALVFKKESAKVLILCNIY